MLKYLFNLLPDILFLQVADTSGFFAQWVYVLMFMGGAAIAYWLGKKQGSKPNHTSQPASDEEAPIENNLLEELQEKYRLVFKEAALGMAIVDPEGYTRVTNTYFQKMMGYSEEELNQMTFGEFTHPDDLEKDLNLYQQVLDREIDHYEMEKRYIHKDGHIIWGYLTVSVIRDKQGNILNALGMVQDITDRKQLDEQLKVQSEQFGLFVKYVPAGVAMVDNNMRYIAFSDRWYEDYGIRGDVVGKSHYELFPQILEMPEWLEIHQKCLSGETAKKEKDLMLDEAGKEVWIRWEIHPWRNYTGEIGGIIMFTEVITDKVKAENEIREKQELLELVIDNMNEGLVVVGEDNKLEIMHLPHLENISTAGINTQGINLEYLMNQHHLYHKDGDTLVKKEEHPVSRALSGEIFSNYLICVKPEQTEKPIIFSNSGAPLKDAQGSIKGAVIVFRDATQQFELQQKTEELNAHLEEMVQQRTAELEASNKELESFSYSVSHDLRAPLRAVAGFSRILANDYQKKLDEDGQRYLQMIIDNSNNMGQLIDDLLEFSRLGRKALKTEPLDMTELVRQIWQEQIDQRHADNAELDLDDLPEVMADRAMIKQVWVNLISNALKFSAHRDKPIIKISGEPNENGITYHITDNGVGFDMKYYNKLFGVFQRLHSATDFEGTGVGLALSHRIITKHGGKIWAESIPDSKTTFHFNIPVNHGKSS